MRTLEIPVVFEVTNIEFGPIEEIFTEELRAAVGDCILHVQERVKSIIDKEDIYNEGHLVNSIASAMSMSTSPIEGTVGTNLKYARYVEDGTIPHFVPFHMAKSLYNQAKGDWGWVEPPPKKRAELNARPNKAVRKEGGFYLVTGRHQTYAYEKHPERLWLCPAPGARPAWGVFVSGKAQPFMWPGWQQSLEYIEGRLLEACQRAAARVNGGA